MIMKLLCFIYRSPKLYLPMHFSLLCIRLELLLLLCYCSWNHLWLLNWQCIRSLQNSTGNVNKPIAEPFISTVAGSISF